MWPTITPPASVNRASLEIRRLDVSNVRISFLQKHNILVYFMSLKLICPDRVMCKTFSNLTWLIYPIFLYNYYILEYETKMKKIKFKKLNEI